MHSSTAREEIAEGVRYVFSNPLVMALIGAVGMVNFFGFGFLNLLACLGNGRAAQRRDHQWLADIGARLRRPRQRADAGFSR